MHFVTLLIFGYICLFLIPASIRSPKWFLAVWGLCAALLAFGFARHLARSKTADALAQMFDRALLDVAALAMALALGAFALRWLAQCRSWTEYPHWLVLLLGCAVIPAALFTRFTL